MNGTGRDEHKRDGKCTGPGAIIRNGTGETNGTGATLKNSRPMLLHYCFKDKLVLACALTGLVIINHMSNTITKGLRQYILSSY